LRPFPDAARPRPACREQISWRAEIVSNALLILCFLTLGTAILMSGYRAVIGLLPSPVYVVPNRVAAHLIIALWALVALSFVAWYVTDLEFPEP